MNRFAGGPLTFALAGPFGRPTFRRRPTTFTEAGSYAPSNFCCCEALNLAVPEGEFSLTLLTGFNRIFE